MKNIRKSLKTSAFIIIAVLFLAQAIRIDRSNQPVRADLSADPAIHSVLRRACYNCHSNETSWPWYSGVAPVSWLVGSDVEEGRQHVNFSEWGNYDQGTQSHKLRGIAEELQKGDMPPWYYTIVHTESRLSTAERDQIVNWALETARAAGN